MWTIGHNRQRTCQGISRRGFVQIGCLGAMGLSLPDLLQAQAVSKPAGKKRSVILIWLWGGPSHLDTFDPKPDAPADYKGPFRPTSTNVPGIQICELLPRLAKQADKYALLRSIHHETNDHGIAGTIGLTGKAAVSGKVMPSMGAIVARMKGFHPPLSSFASIGKPLHQGHRPIQGEGGGILGSNFDPFRIEYDEITGVQLRDLNPPEDVTRARLDRRRLFLDVVESAQKQLSASKEVRAQSAVYDQAFSLITS